jgi:outer membrane protein OmpA-like peptidoglycan-associated protein
MEKEKSEDPRLERSALRCNLAGRTNACEDDRGEDRRLAGYKIAEKGHIMSKLFLLIVLAFLADTASIGFAQHPTVTWEIEKPNYAEDYPERLKDYHGLVILQRSTVEVFSLLNMIFFPKDSSTLQRYTLYTTPDQTTGFSEDATNYTIVANYDILNFLGYRLRNYPNKTIGLLGCSGNDAGGLALATSRAETIKNYLVTIWGIDAKRIKINTKVLPEHPSDVTTEKGREENRRVEIISDDWNIMGAIVARRYVRFPDPRRVLLYVSPITDPTITERKIKITYDHKPWKTIVVPTGDTTIEWNWRSDLTGGLTPLYDGRLRAQLFLTDAKGLTTESSIDSLDVKLIEYQTVPENPGNTKREVYYIPLRPDEEVTIGKLNKMYIDTIVLGRITPKSDVEIVGYVNDDTRKNRDQSQLLNAAIKKYIEPKTIISNSEIRTRYYSDGVLFDPQYPEGRMLNRSAEIIIETPWSYIGSR